MDSRVGCEIAGLKTQIGALKELMHTHINYQEKAVETATLKLDDRLEGMNEFRDALKDKEINLVTRLEVKAMIDNINATIEKLSKVVDKHQDTITNWQGRLWAFGTIITMASGAVAALVAWLLKG